MNENEDSHLMEVGWIARKCGGGSAIPHKYVLLEQIPLLLFIGIFLRKAFAYVIMNNRH